MIVAYIMIKTVSGKERNVHSELKGFCNGVKEVAIIYGEYDIFVKYQGKSTMEVSKFVHEILRKIAGVKATTTFIAESV
jgi:DNA-binding Lrp family transcriptional regulator